MITNTSIGLGARMGNQMFHYAMLLGVSAKRGYEVRIPRYEDDPKKKVSFELRNMLLTARTLRAEDHKRIKRVYRLRQMQFDPRVFEQEDYTDYMGSFHSERYFAHCEELVRREFRFVPTVGEWAEKTLDNLRTTSDAVAVSVRRGDYANYARYHVLSEQYLRWAMCLMQEQVGRPCCFFVFSDDLPWCKQHLAGTRTFFPEYPSHYHQLALMSSCDQHIISGSSFSWWGAWLGKNPRQTVIAPEPWFGPKEDGTRDNLDDIHPEDWHRLRIDSIRSDAPSI